MWDENTKVLVVDDHDDIRKVVARFLRDNMRIRHIQEAEDGQAALDILEREDGRFDLVLSDFSMPRMNGECLLRESRSRFPDLPFVIISADYTKERDLIDAGAYGFIVKPAQAERMFEVISGALESTGKPKT